MRPGLSNITGMPLQISVCGFQAGEQLLSLIVATLTASVAIGAGQIVANVVNSRNN